MRLKSAIWVAAYLRRCHGAGAFAVVMRKGAEDAGAIFIRIDMLNGEGRLLGPAPQTMADDDGARRFIELAAVSPDPEISAALEKQIRFDPDLWVVAVEDRTGSHHLGDDEIARG